VLHEQLGHALLLHVALQRAGQRGERLQVVAAEPELPLAERREGAVSAAAAT
jgi:hypothetical protein